MTFIDMYVKYMTGPLGNNLFIFIKQHTLAITSVVAVYGAVLTFAAYNSKTWMMRKTDRFIKDRAKEIVQTKTNIPDRKLVSQLLKEWGGMVEKLPRYRFIPSKHDFWIVFPNAERFAKLLKIDEEYIEEVLEELKSMA